ncbi:IclR family transcriptional regulator [Novosphingobium sp.]|uniref:IclR family transcriptional regulator n=1 Tax=Novosphingobium sp. TaxID=1874826 RepID=UPI003D117FA7
MAPSASSPGVKSALRTLDLIEYVVAKPAGVGAQEIAAALAIPISSLSYLLATLVERGYLRREGRIYVAGAGLDRLQRPRGELSLIDLARPLVRALRQQTNETTSLFVAIGWEVEAVVTETSNHNLRYAIDVGRRTPMHCVSAGKALLAYLPQPTRERYFAEAQRERFTPFTVCDRSALENEFAATRDTGFAFTREEYTIGIYGIGVPVRAKGQVVAALSIGLPTSRLTPDMQATIMAQLGAASRAIEAAQ